MTRIVSECIGSALQIRSRNWKTQKRAKLAAVAKAVAFLGGSLVIDWRDRHHLCWTPAVQQSRVPGYPASLTPYIWSDLNYVF